jgi:hypothetical protein
MRYFRRGILILILAVAVLDALDFIVFEVRLSRGGGLSTVSVEQYLRTSLKGQKSEFYFQGTKSVDCPQSLFPQRVASQWTPPCWWLERHPQHWQEASL